MLRFPGQMSATVTVPGYTVTGVAGVGADGTVHRGTDGHGRPVVIRQLREAPAGLLARVRTAAAVRHPGIAAVHELVELPGGPAVVQDLIDGPTLSTLRAARRGLSAAECAQLATELLAAVETLHAAGIIHGDVSPANVIIAPTQDGHGRPVLVDLVGGAGPDRGTRGFRAPEVDSGTALGTAADVFSVAQLSLWAAEPGAREEVGALLAPLRAPEPGERPSARQAQQLLDGGAQAPIRLAPADVLASATLREHAARELTTRVRTRRARPRRRHRARRRRWVVRAAGVAVLLGMVAAGLAWADVPDRAGAATAAKAGPSNLPVEEAGPAAALRTILAGRDDALTAGDAVALAELTAPGSALAATDADLLEELTDTGVQLRGYRTDVLDPTVVTVDPDSATVRAELSQAAHERRAADGAVTEVPEQAAQCVQVELARANTDEPWRAASVTGC